MGRTKRNRGSGITAGGSEVVWPWVALFLLVAAITARAAWL